MDHYYSLQREKKTYSLKLFVVLSWSLYIKHTMYSLNNGFGSCQCCVGGTNCYIYVCCLRNATTQHRSTPKTQKPEKEES